MLKRKHFSFQSPRFLCWAGRTCLWRRGAWSTWPAPSPGPRLPRPPPPGVTTTASSHSADPDPGSPSSSTRAISPPRSSSLCQPGDGVMTVIGCSELCSLLLFYFRSSDSGVYTCVPDNAPSTNVTLHVLTGIILIYFIYLFIFSLITLAGGLTFVLEQNKQL